MRTYEQIKADATKGSAFSNGSEFEAWASNWCQSKEPCKHFDTCPMITVALLDPLTPTEWVPDQPRSLGRQYTCTEYTKEA